MILLPTESIIVNLLLERNVNVTENTTDDSLINNIKQLQTALLNGTLVLVDINNKTITVPVQQLQRNEISTAGLTELIICSLNFLTDFILL